MIKCTLEEISFCVKGKLFGLKNIIIDNISINSKKINTKHSLFLAFKGDNYDSHKFINESINNGAIAIISEYYLNYININQIIVKNTNDAFYKISKLIRNKSKALIVAITGSCGKTTIKEMTSSILKESKNNFSCTIDNNNNNIGVAITLLNINIEDKFVIIEVGMNKLGEIFKSIKLIKPNIILINNIFITHLEFLESLKNLIISKGEIFYGLLNNGRFILNFFNNYWNEWKFIFCNINKCPIFFSLSYYKYSDFYAYNFNLNNLSSNFFLKTPVNNFNININLPGIHNISNAIASSSISVLLGIKTNYIKNGLNKFLPVQNRLNPIFIKKNKLILDDTYNSNIESVYQSIKVLSNISGFKVLVIGDMNELGILTNFLHNYISNKIKNSNINKVISIGNFSKLITNYLNNGEHVYCKNTLINKILFLIKNNEKITILFKASKKINLSEVINTIINLYKK